MSLRNRLSILIGAALLPPIALLAYDMVATRSRDRQRLLTEAHQQAQLVAGQIESTIQGARRLSWALSQQTRIMRADAVRCPELLRNLVNDTPLYRAAIVTDKDGAVVCSWPKVEGVSLRDRDYFKDAMRQPDLVIGTLILKGRITEASALPLARRFSGESEGGGTGVLVLGLDLDLMAREFETRYGQADRYLSVVDREGTIILRVPGQSDAVGKKASSEAIRRTQGTESGSFVWDDAAGRRSIIGYAKVDGLLVSIGFNPRSVLTQVDSTMWLNTALLAIAVLLALGAAWLVGEKLVRQPVSRLVDAARRHESGERAVPFPDLNSTTELGTLSRALNRMSEANEALLGQREILMRELQHRVMNSLQLLASVLQLQARNADPAVREQLEVARQRIVSMSTIFRYLYRADLRSTVEFGAFLEGFCRDTARAYLGPDATQLEVECDRLEIPIEHALSLALMTHELITNALKHAFGARTGTIRVRFEALPGGSSRLTVTDDGKGLPADFDVNRSKSLGMVLVHRLTRSMQGTLDIRSGASGTVIAISLPPLNEPAAKT